MQLFIFKFYGVYVVSCAVDDESKWFMNSNGLVFVVN